MHFRLVDANSLGYAHHHAQEVSWVEDMQTQAVAGVLNAVRNNIRFQPNVFNVFLWDGRAQWRYDLHPGYKAGRLRTPEQRQARARYERQRPWLQRALAHFPVVQLTHPGAEADDLAWGVGRQLARQGHLVSLLTADHDWLQMVSGRLQWVNARKPSHVVDADNFARESGGYIKPEYVADLKALTGDVSDDIDGLPDVALKRAGQLLARYGSLASVLEASEDFLVFSAEPKHYHSLMLPQMRELVLRNKRLVDLSCAPVLRSEDVQFVVGEFCDLELFSLFIDLDFQQMQDGFAPWSRPLQAPASEPAVNALRRAVAQIHTSWPVARG